MKGILASVRKTIESVKTLRKWSIIWSIVLLINILVGFLMTRFQSEMLEEKLHYYDHYYDRGFTFMIYVILGSITLVAIFSYCCCVNCLFDAVHDYEDSKKKTIAKKYLYKGVRGEGTNSPAFANIMKNF